MNDSLSSVYDRCSNGTLNRTAMDTSRMTSMELCAAVRRLECPQSSLPDRTGRAGVSNPRQPKAARHDGAERTGRLLAKVRFDRQRDEANRVHEGPDTHGEHHE